MSARFYSLLLCEPNTKTRYMHLIVHVWTHMLAGLINKEETPRPIHPIIGSNDAYARVHKHHICREAGPPWSRLPTDRIQEELAGMDSIFTLNQDRCKWNGTNANVIKRGKHSADRQKRLLNACGVSREQRQCRARRRHTHRTVHLYLLVVTRFPARWNLHTARPQVSQPFCFSDFFAFVWNPCQHYIEGWSKTRRITASCLVQELEQRRTKPSAGIHFL